ncbi:MAG: hypothetical protein ACOYYJ_11800 [Chloroflexota bacterium]
MNAYTRSTRECKFGDLRPELTASISRHIETYKLGDVEASLVICCETTSVCQKTGLFASGNETTVAGMFVTPQLLVWTNGEEKRKPVVTSALLRNISAHDFENTAMYRVNPDSGINITGRYTDVTKQGQSFIGLGPDPAGEKFRQVLQLAIQKAQSGRKEG